MSDRRDGCEREEPGFGQAFLACFHQRAVELEKMDHAQVDLSDRGRIIVDQADAGNPAGARHFDFLVELAPHGGLVGVQALASLSVFFGDVSADAERTQPVQPGFSLRFATRVAEDGVGTAEDDIGNNLLEAGVGLDLGPRAVLHQFGHKQRRQVAVGVGGKTLKTTETVKLGTRNDQDTFVDFWDSSPAS